ncbi:MAG: hypothetical protein DHS20C18_15060 [Saprospiraceae bacterium]|nr:MAG: hypothetical protein DHS20C18_15060 [Saprospiraceae bacterium]
MAQGGLFIGNGANVVVNNSPKIVIQDGKFINDGNFEGGNSTVYLTGTTATENSTIGGTAVTPFNNLIISKSSNDVRLDFDIQVDGDLRMDGGLLILNYSDIVLGGVILGETSDNRITGTEGGAIIKTLVLDMPSEENPGNLGAEITAMASLGSTTIRRSHVQQLSESGNSIFRVYEFEPENNNNLDATLRLHYFEEELDGLDENSLELWQYNNAPWTSLGSEGSNAEKNWVITSGISSLYTITLAKEMSAPLPVELLDFKAIVNNRKEVDLFWTTATEINNDYFTIERSKEGIRFEAISEVDGAGNTDQSISYQSTDKNPFAGINYYRLKQTDFDGTFSYSEIRVVNIEQDRQTHFSIYPNPMNTILNIVNDGRSTGRTIIKIYDAIGHLKYDTAVDMNGSNHSTVITEVSKFIAGNYFLVLQSPTETQTFNLVKIR